MRIVVLDGYTLNPGDLHWDPLLSLGHCTIFDRTAPADVITRAIEAGVVLTNKTPLRAETIAALHALRYIGVLATGFDVVDIEAARAMRIPVTNVPAYSTMSVAQLVFAHLFNLTHRIGHHTDAVRAGRWSAAKDFMFSDYPLTEVCGLTMGVVGLGRIGQAVADAALGFGMRVVAAGSNRPLDPPPRVQEVTLNELFAMSDVVTLHCPLTPATRNLVSRDRLALMKPAACLINTSRGALIDEPALADALNARRIAGAGLDVLSVEPPPADHPLLRANNCFITPHVGWATVAARERLLHEAVENVKAFLQGTPRNVVNA
ncbi:MAG: D-2-hydroxyacid dehydrogenase [Bacteroidota bacterium]